MMAEVSECKLLIYRENHYGTVRRIEFETRFDPREAQEQVLTIAENEDFNTFLVIDVFDPIIREIESLRKENAGLRAFMESYLEEDKNEDD